MKRLSWTLLVAATFALGACGDDGGDDGDNPFADIGADAGSGDAGADDAGTDGATCETPCTSSRECAATGGVCEDGCCVESDAGGEDTGVVGCGDITFEGECDGTIVRWCNNGALQELDCATWVPGLSGSCEFISDSFGFYCAFPPTSACLVDDGQGNITPLLCTGTEPACELDGESATCVENVGSCTAPAQQGETFARTCIDDFLAVDCNVVQPVGFDCVAFGGTCGDDACVGIPADGQCDGDQLQCADGFDCEGASDTAFGTCVERVATCDDGIQNQDEEGVDCGGETCDACPEPTCEDGVQNGDEEGVDCGGATCDACPTCDDGVQNGDEEGIDCGGETCDACPEPTCDDGIQNGDEEGIDCGGETCDACAEPTCEDGVQNGDEEGVDCGGTTCDACPTCDDGVQNGTEEAIDCGGDACAACECLSNDACDSLNCDETTGTCIDASCDDGVLNQDEVAIDCGGETCDACECTTGDECDSLNCDIVTGTCLEATCDDFIQNGDEEDIDCGGAFCDPCDF